MKYKLIKRKNSTIPSCGKYVAKAVHSRTVTGDDIAELFNLGTFKLELESHAVDTPEDFDPVKHIRRPVLRVLPKSKSGKPELYKDINYELVK